KTAPYDREVWRFLLALVALPPHRLEPGRLDHGSSRRAGRCYPLGGESPVLPAEEEKPFKEILYLLVEEVKATKAAFYLGEPNGSFQLATQYGFNRADRLPDRLQRTDALAIDIYEHREPHVY